MKVILGFHNEFRFLSNFFPCNICYEGLIYPSTEHAYQAAKTLDHDTRMEMLAIKKAGDVKKAGKTVPLRPDWEDIKLDVMYQLCKEKFSQDSFKEKLLATGDAYLEETNHWNDYYWGVCKGIGENHLGKILMKIREELRGL